MRIMARFPWDLGVPAEVANAITPPSPSEEGENPSATCLDCAINSAESSGWEGTISGISWSGR